MWLSQLTLVNYRNFGHLRRITLKGSMHRDATASAFWRRLIPSRLLCGQIEHGEMSRML